MQADLPTGCSPSSELDCPIKGSKGNEECVDCVPVEGVGMEDGDPPDEAVAKHGITHLRWLECHFNGLEQALEWVWDSVPDGEPCPQLKIGCGILRVWWCGWSMHDGDALIGHHVLTREGDANESLPFHFWGSG